MKIKIRYFKGQLSPMGELAGGIGLVGQVALDKVAIDTVSKLGRGRRAKARRHKRKAVA